jgi:hypothetical protein
MIAPMRQLLTALPCLLLSLLGACEERVDVVDARNLRVEIKRPQNEYVIKVDVLMRDSDYVKIENNELLLSVQKCGAPTMSEYPDYGVLDQNYRSTPQDDRMGAFTFDMGLTSVPATVPDQLQKFKCVRLFARRGYGLVGYHSDLLTVH